MRTRALLAGFVVLFGATWYLAGSERQLMTGLSSTEVERRLNAVIPVLLKEEGIQSLSLALISNYEISLVRAFGSRSMGQIATNSTVYQAASLGKPVFARLIKSDAISATMHLDQPLLSYKENFLAGGNPELTEVTARSILSHTSGVVRIEGSGLYGTTATLDKTFNYSSAGYNLLQRVLEKNLSTTLEKSIEEHVFLPLGMTNSKFAGSNEATIEMATGNDSAGWLDPGKAAITDAYAASSLMTTPSDYARFVIAEMNELRSLTFADAEVFVTDSIAWSLGWGLQRTKPSVSIWHWGSNPGFRSFVVAYPQEGVGIVIFSNSENLFKVLEELVEVTIGGELPAYDWF